MPVRPPSRRSPSTPSRCSGRWRPLAYSGVRSKLQRPVAQRSSVIASTPPGPGFLSSSSIPFPSQHTARSGAAVRAVALSGRRPHHLCAIPASPPSSLQIKMAYEIP
ncbi:hypothetical protein GUJ93_ZPchr0012g20306 [Zizania palustris]|uniref:Uncharacterized protein n=1 Tax=Zizania palustris TaxID=103762 RepID=A0A8J5WQX9_ZIZPA|nr:hypothetical protein GUJ93_ZPchr0012g20306 [Zizania palustris]